MDTLLVTTTLFKRNAVGIGTWKIWCEDGTIFYSHATVLGGAEVQHQEEVTVNQSGRSIGQQMLLQMESRISRMKDKGYKTSIEEANKGATNQLGLTNPMLAFPISKASYIDWENAFIQRKYDGHRCMITKQNGEIIAYTRKGKPINTIQHIIDLLEPVMPEGMTLDGELYIHGKSLQGIASLIKRHQPGSANLSYRCYDMVSDQVYLNRLDQIMQVVYPIRTVHLDVVETIRVFSAEEAWAYFRKYKDEGYEGAMLRISDRGYQQTIRTTQLLKLKDREEAEYEIIDIHAGKNDVGIMVLKLPDGQTFDCLCPGTVPHKQMMLARKEEFIGTFMPVEYAMLTDAGIPFHCVAVSPKEAL